MYNSRAALLDLLNLVSAIELRIMSKNINFSDPVETTNLERCFETVDEILTNCDTTEAVSRIKERINVARETVQILKSTRTFKDTDTVYADLYMLKDKKTVSESSYGRHLGITDDEFDKMIEEWAEDKQNTLYTQKKRQTYDNAQDQIKGELAKLADAMKSKALWYRDVLVKDNKALSKYTGEQEKQLDTVTHVTRDVTKFSRASSLSIRQMIMMVISMFALTVLMLIIFIIT
ncbi:hypothetical protein BEWA_033780 [Theileria equi strain WA]|uniref:Uncharacterized protein n=1 Tax=Theileria equi strain WA TaxID=1537102 RepID=L0AZ53_THEEQ|nr:hypothetical protein BEWA_033780 [Theileria equi strain WA]AFZ80523.1 hypothetical protein BEWA_033780 [Theileria equi strain WA]|eukprot:XP_004830189.1 hypothetical protein BEWA_033780 [Theileria equi strain WA]